MLTRQTQTKFELGERRRLTFYAAVYDEPAKIREYDEQGKIRTYKEVILPGAFTDTLASGNEVLATIDHDANQTYARLSDGSLVIQDDPHGLFCSCWLPDNDIGNKVYELVQAGRIYGCSFRFYPMEDRTQGDTVARAKVKLADVCVALKMPPAYLGTDVHLRTANNMSFLIARYKYAKMKNWTLHNGNS